MNYTVCLPHDIIKFDLTVTLVPVATVSLKKHTVDTPRAKYQLKEAYSSAIDIYRWGVCMHNAGINSQNTTVSSSFNSATGILH